MTALNAPRDKYNAVWIIFFILGLGTLLPWNFFMTATMYFTSRLKDPPMGLTNQTLNQTLKEEDSRSVLEAKFNNVMTLCAMVPLLIFTCLNSFIHQRIPQKLRISGGLVVILIVFLVTAILVKVDMAPLPFFAITMIKIICINSFGAILQGSLFGLAGILPASYTTPIMSGQGLGGAFAAFSMICALASGSALQDSAFGYFITACVVISLAIMSYMALPRMEFFQHYMETNRSRPSADEENKMDLLNKGAAHKLVEPGIDSIWLPVLVAARLVFVPLFMLCNVQPRYYLPVFFSHDAWYIIFMIFFSFSNGYLASLCMCFGPKKVPPHEAETAGAIMAFFLSLGLALGASVSFAVRAMI
uniref:Solute carrier family 29 member 1a n=1 Tax=Takifugu rubripes TaxID=31033 RepID=A0A674NEL9_TAKRU